jgi:hypothetical protein
MVRASREAIAVAVKLQTTLILFLVGQGAYACLGSRTPNETAARHFSSGRREVQKEEVCSVATSFPNLTRVSTVFYNGRCDGGVFVWDGEVFEDGRTLGRELLRRLDYTAKAPEQRASLALRVVREVAFHSLPVSTSESPPCAACEPLSVYHVPRVRLKSDGGVSVELWHHFDDLVRYRIDVGRDGSLGSPLEIGRYKCAIRTPAGKNETDHRCGVACSRASACDPAPPPEPATPVPFEPSTFAHGVFDPAVSHPQYSKLMSRVRTCTNECTTAHLTAEDFECLAAVSGTLFLGQSNTLPARQCRAQRATDRAGTNDPTVLDAVLEPLAASAEHCEKAKATNHAGLKQSMPNNLTAADIDRLHKYFWEDFDRSQSVLNPKSQNAGFDPAIELTKAGRAVKRAHREAVAKAMSALDTQLLTSSCKAALAAAIAKSGKQCDAADAGSAEWVRAVRGGACGMATSP